MTETDEKIWAKCDYCGEIFTIPRKDLDVPTTVTAITSMIKIPFVFQHPIITGVVCEYAVAAPIGDFCGKCCRLFLKLGLEEVEHQIKTGEFVEF